MDRRASCSPVTGTARDLDLRPGKSPSSTVIIFRYTASHAECLVLGDSLAVLAGQAVTDDLPRAKRHDDKSLAVAEFSRI